MQFTDEQKKQLEQEVGFYQYLIKTKQAKAVGKQIFVDDVLISEITEAKRKLLYDKYEDEQLLVLEFITIGQMMIETIDQMDSNYYGNVTPIKTALEVVKKKLTNPIERDFKTVHQNGSKSINEVNEVNGLIKELELFVKNISTFRIPSKIVMSKLSRAFNFDGDTMLATAHRVIKKYE